MLLTCVLSSVQCDTIVTFLLVEILNIPSFLVVLLDFLLSCLAAPFPSLLFPSSLFTWCTSLRASGAI